MRIHSRVCPHGLAILISIVLSAAARGQVMADRVPADAVAYGEWAGSDALGGAYEGSHFKALVKTLKLPELIEGTIQEELEKRQQSPQQAENAQVIKQVVAALTKAPTAAYWSGMDFTMPGHPRPRVALFSKVGRGLAAELAEKLKALPVQERQADLHIAAVEDYLLMDIGENAMESRLNGPPPAESLAAAEGFKNTMKQLGAVGNAPAAVVYVDGEAVMKMVNAEIEAQGNPQVREMFPMITESLGLVSLRQAAWAGKFDEGNWQESLFLGMSAHRNGLLAFLDNPPLTDASLKLIPQSATFAGAMRLDTGRLLADLRDVAASMNDRGPQLVETFFQQFYAFTGVQLNKDLLPSLGTEFIYYGSPDATGDLLHGFTLVNPMKDPQKAEASLTAAENFANLLILQRMPDSKAQFITQNLTPPLDKVTAHVMALERVSPAWAIHDGVFFFSLSVQGLQSAIKAAADPAKAHKSILENPKFIALRKKLGHEAMSSFSFADLPANAPEIYGIFSRLMAQAVARDPNALRHYVLPPLNQLTPNLEPLLVARWSDGDGFHIRESAPFPYAESFNGTQLLFLRVAELMEGWRAQPRALRGARVPGAGPLLP